jgi:phosphoribosylformylglycinamidine cyclo-ligase
LSQDRYKEAGVDIDAGARLIDRIAPFARKTTRPEVLGGLGNFASMWQIPAHRYRDLVLVSGTDGVGTKVKVAQMLGKHDTIGIDLVAMCVNDVICTGAEPFFFLDYFACGNLDVDVAAAVIEGIAEGCRQAGCSLVGGETAEMPGVYAPGVYDLAGFSVGGVERDAILSTERVQEGMSVLALPSTGLHSNGYSLARKVLFEELELDPSESLPGSTRSIGEELLEPTAIYVQAAQALLARCEVAGIAHITGGGLLENIPRVLPDGFGVHIKAGTWQRPPLFDLLQERGEISDRDMLRTFNCGVGLIVLLPSAQVTLAQQVLGDLDEESVVIGEVRPCDREGPRVQVL